MRKTSSALKAYLWGEDLKWRILASIAIPFSVDMLGREGSVLRWMENRYFWISLGYGAIGAFVLISYIKFITLYLAKNYDRPAKKTERVILQLILGLGVSAIGVHLFMFLQHQFLLPDSIFATTWLLYEFPFLMVIIILVNLAYMYYYSGKMIQENYEDGENLGSRGITNNIKKTTTLPHGHSAQQPLIEESPKGKSVILALKANKVYPIPVERIALIFREDHLNRLVTFSNEEYIIDLSLDETINQLDKEMFFRVNRQYIVNFNACQSFLAIENNKLELNVTVQTQTKVIISQKTAPSFKDWVNR